MSEQVQNKIGFNFGYNSHAEGWGAYVRELDAAGKQAILMSSGGYGFGDIEGVWNEGSLVPHLAVIRCLTHNDVPRSDLDIDEAVEEWLDRYCPTIGNDVDKYHTRVMTKHGNELDRNQLVWLAEFYEALHPALLDRMGWESHQIVCFNFAAGNPDPDAWASIVPFIELAGNNPDKWVFGLHEYSFYANDIWAKDGGGNLMIGRFQYLYDLCDSLNIKRPLVVSHEWGWQDKFIANPTEQAIRDIDDVMENLLSNYPEYLGGGIWTLQEWQGSNVSYQAQALIDPVKNLTLSKMYDCAEEPPPIVPPIDPENPPERDEGKAREPYARTYIVADPNYLSENERQALYLSVAQTGESIGGSYDDAGIGTGLKSKTAVLMNVPDEKKQELIDWYERWYPSTIVKFGTIGEVAPPTNDRETALNYADLVVDVSYANNTVDYEALKANGVKKINVRLCSEAKWNSTNEIGIDVMADEHIREALAAGMELGAYYWVGSAEEYDLQAQRFFGVVEMFEITYDFLFTSIAIDIEGDSGPQGEAEIKTAVEAFMDFNNTGLRPVIYTGAWWWNGQIPSDCQWIREYGLDCWAAWYVTGSGTPLESLPSPEMRFGVPNGWVRDEVIFWQFTSTAGDYLGQSKMGLDLNYYLFGEESGSNPDPEPEPEPTGSARFGIHVRADGGDTILSNDFSEVAAIPAPKTIKVMTSTSEHDIRRYAAENPGCHWIVRAFLDFGGRNISPEQFVNDTLNDLKRTLNAIPVPNNQVFVEIHNEPNLSPEGLYSSWQNGTEFGAWILNVFDTYKAQLPTALFMLPAMSPGASQSGFKIDDQLFFDDMKRALGYRFEEFDGVAIHAYWAYNYSMSSALAHVDATIAKCEGLPVSITEASNNKQNTAEDMAEEYVQFVNELRKRPTVQDVTFFVLSASNQIFAHEVWVKETNESRGIAGMIADMV